jgi:hypothetical protein
VLALAAAGIAACSSSATPAPSVAPAPSALPAGIYTSLLFEPAVTYTVPVGWTVPSDTSGYLLLSPAGSEVLGIHLFSGALPASQAADCPIEPAAGVGTTAADFTTWIRERPGFTVSDPVPATVGGLSGQMVDIGIVDGWAASCPFANGLPTVPLLVDVATNLRWVIAGDERLRLYLLDRPGGGTVLVDIDDYDGSQIDALISAATPIVDSFSFAAASPSPASSPSPAASAGPSP